MRFYKATAAEAANGTGPTFWIKNLVLGGNSCGSDNCLLGGFLVEFLSNVHIRAVTAPGAAFSSIHIHMSHFAA